MQTQAKHQFTLKHRGCYFDGSRGVYIGKAIQKMALEHGWRGQDVLNINNEDYEDYDYWEATDEAIDYLNSLCEEDVRFILEDSFILVKKDDIATD